MDVLFISGGKCVAKRQYCERCHYPETVCICSAVTTMSCKPELIILQHPQEANHAKNTARLVQLSLPDTQIIQGENQHDFAHVAQKLCTEPDTYALIYPSDTSEDFESFETRQKVEPFKGLVFIDATWRKAFKMWHLNPWLQQLPAFHLTPQQQGNYQIRKAPSEQSLSTLEAVAQVLEQGCKVNSQPLLRLFESWQQTVFSRHEKIRENS